MRMAAVEKAGENVEKMEVFDRHRHYSPGKPDAFPAQNALKSGVEHQISVSRKASIFFWFFLPAFPMLPCRITQGRTGGGEAGSGGGRGGLDPPGWADRREIVVRKMGENEKKA